MCVKEKCEDFMWNSYPHMFLFLVGHEVEERFFAKFITYDSLLCHLQKKLLRTNRRRFYLAHIFSYKMSSSCSDESDILDLKEIEKEITQLVDKDYLEGLLKLQVSEYEMLESMFPNPGELSVDDYSVLADIDDYLNGRTSAVPPQLDYTITLKIEGQKLEVCVNLPLEYPNVKPDIFLRSENLNRTQQRALNKDLANFVSELDRGDICIFSAVSWLQEKALDYFINKINEPEQSKSVKEEESFSRYWIYSHHIYSKIKRRKILDLAEEYQLTGFCLPGRPGIICLEGFSSDCEECWQKIKGMSWKKIMCRNVEETKLDFDHIEKLRKFPNFQEVSFENKSNKKHEFHMDFGEFYKYLSSHQCEYIFKDYFGMDGK